MEHMDMQPFLLPENARVWIEAGEFDQEEAKSESRLVLRAINGIRIELSKSDVATVNGKILLRNGAEVHNFRELNPNVEFANTCEVFGQPNNCYLNDKTCVAVVVICHYCCYKPSGAFDQEKSKICGACIGV